MSNQDNLQPATDIDPNVWYYITENVNDYNDDFKSMLQPGEDGRSREFPIANGTTYWRFLSIGQRPGRYALRCSEIANKKELAVSYRGSESVENQRIRACLQDSHGNDGQLWDIALWGHNTYRFINVANGSKYHLRVIPVAAYNAAFPNMPQPTTNPTTAANSASSTTAIAYADYSSRHSKLSRGAIATTAIGSLLCVLAIAFLGYYMYIVAATLSRSLG
ncbi:hypothetical protein FALBO_7891 [Fusarium albosuccineum]|uniref:Uncharacterized protein n=1 Tax=Fusarium albosuccineum TaxID=1237068 RepID=A0A8H4LAH6_9HYPO|nr:hypothetical protein FALBO_7891 [Fusarium albosuccineum]